MWFYNGINNNESIIEYCKIHNPTTIILNTDTEWFWRITKEQVNLLYKTGVKNIIIIFGSFRHTFYEDYFEQIGIPIENIVFWSTFWFNWSELLCRYENDYKSQIYNNFLYPFISLNNKSHDHRCAMIDMITKHELLNKGIVTWNKTPYPNLNYKFKYYDNSFRGLSDNFVTKLDSFLICEEQHKSFLHVIGEATCSVPFITEKTVIPMLYKKPFVTLSLPNFNMYLKSLGFELFDEIIDYSYDSIPVLEDRAESMVKNILPLTNDNLNLLYKKLLPKLEHNYNRVWEIIKNKNYIPKIIHDRYENRKDNKLEGFDGRYQIFIEQIPQN